MQKSRHLRMVGFRAHHQPYGAGCEREDYRHLADNPPAVSDQSSLFHFLTRACGVVVETKYDVYDGSRCGQAFQSIREALRGGQGAAAKASDRSSMMVPHPVDRQIFARNKEFHAFVERGTRPRKWPNQ